MSKGLSYHYSGTIGHIIATAQSLPKNPDKLLSDGWIEITNTSQRANSSSREFKEISSGLRIRFDKGQSGKPGFRGLDHYHIRNPNATENSNMYLDKNGKPTRKGHKNSHILPKEN